MKGTLLSLSTINESKVRSGGSQSFFLFFFAPLPPSFFLSLSLAYYNGDLVPCYLG